MNHLSDEQLVDALYGELALPLQPHLASCAECTAGLQLLKRQLDTLGGYPAPARDAAYGAAVWNRLQPRLHPPQRPKTSRSFLTRPWVLVPAFAASLILAFFIGVWTQGHRALVVTPQTGERVFLLATSDHLQRSEIALTELLHAAPGSADLERERTLARSLLAENRLLRQTALRLGDGFHAALLDDLERVLLDVANGPAARSPEDLTALQQRIENDRLLWKVRITSSNARQQGQKL